MRTNPERVVQTLEKAKSILLTKGWGRSVNYNPHTGCYCINGALDAAGNGDDYSDAWSVLAGVTLDVWGHDPIWANDKFFRGRDDAIRALDLAIEKVEATA